jgi:pimeloyl-ACP methyl ester carboxylesterase
MLSLSMLGHLVHVDTSDGIKLNGFLARAQSSIPQSSGRVWIIVHGVNGNFYSSTMLAEIAEALHRLGQSILLINTRGHDIVSFNTGANPCRVGSQIESLQSCPLDFQAWYDFCLQLGLTRVSVLGHSLGALKACLWATSRPGKVDRLALVSPPRLNTDLLLADPVRGLVFREHLQDAVELCASGSPDRVMKVRFPLPMWICASTYVDKYGSGDAYDYLQLLQTIDAPCLWTFGEQETRRGTSNFKDADVVLQQAILDFGKNSNQSVVVIENADHSYRESRPRLVQTLLNWIDSTR